MKQSIRILILFAALLFCIQLMIQPVLAEEDHIVLDFFYSSGCGSCDVKLKLIEDEFEYNETYQDILVVVKKDIAANHTYRTEWKEKYSTVSYPFVVIKNETNETVIPKQHIEVVYIANVLDAYIAGMTPNETFDINESGSYSCPWRS